LHWCSREFPWSHGYSALARSWPPSRFRHGYAARSHHC